MGLADVVAPGSLVEPQSRYLADLMGRGVQGTADAVVLPSSVDEVAAVMRWCYDNDVPLTARGGGTGLAGGAIPVEGGVVIGFERLSAIRAFDPLLWRMHVEAGVTTADVHRLARENGLRFPPDPGAAEQSQIGGNIACNAGGPHAFKYGVTGRWVTGIEAVVPPGEIVRTGGPLRKDVAAYDLTALLVGSEGTLGIITEVTTKDFDGRNVRNHAKFLAIDHRFLLVTSANFSWSAEYGNVEFGVLVDNRNLTEAVEREMLQAEDLLYERVPKPTSQRLT
ncbi:MAG: FAD-binding protein [Gaiellaceae bacterium]